MKQASLVIIGDEILSGRTEDKNLAYLAKWLDKLGISLSEVRVVLDYENAIISAVNSLRKKFEEVYSKTRILEKPNSYILDQDHHNHPANQSKNFDWQFFSAGLC